MRKTITITGIILILIAFFMQPFFMNALFAFVFAGVIPGTAISLPFWAMSLVLFSFGYGAVKWLQRDMMFIGDELYAEKKRKQVARVYVMQKANRKQPTKRPTRLRQRTQQHQQTATS